MTTFATLTTDLRDAVQDLVHGKDMPYHQLVDLVLTVHLERIFLIGELQDAEHAVKNLEEMLDEKQGQLVAQTAAVSQLELEMLNLQRQVRALWDKVESG